jgi:hypothetical protein
MNYSQTLSMLRLWAKFLVFIINKDPVLLSVRYGITKE